MARVRCGRGRVGDDDDGGGEGGGGVGVSLRGGGRGFVAKLEGEMSVEVRSEGGR